MLKPKDYIIEFNKLTAGANTDSFALNEEFIKMMDAGSGLKADVTADLLLTRSENMYDLRFKLTGKMWLECDVCLDELEMPVEKEFSFIIKLSESEKYDDDEIVYVTPQTIDFDLRQYLYECLVLSVPIRKVCAMGGKECNPAVIEKLRGISLESGEEEGGKSANDPRWDKLKGFFN